MKIVTAVAAGIVLSGAFAGADGTSSVSKEPKTRRALIHSHNDYVQKRPFWGAYEAGADSIEADVYLVDGEVLVAHLKNELKPENTLRRLYLEPIRSVFKKNGGKIRADGRPVQLVIDVKDGKATLDRLVEIIEEDGLRPCFDVKNNPAAMRLVSGARYVKNLRAYPDYVHFSVSPDMKFPAELYGTRITQMTQSARKYTRWRKGKMPEKDKAKIRAAIDAAHAKGCRFRLWAFPDTPEAWTIIRELGADYINTDNPAKLADFLRTSVRAP